jgi:MYXO-CTERM domain-containing protein
MSWQSCLGTSVLRFTRAAAAALLASGFASIVSSARADFLVIAPHPDDDILTSAGVTYRALHASPAVPVWVLYMTNGDDIGRDLGYQRQNEAAAAEALLGVDAAHLVFLGYQDGSLSEIRGPNYATADSFYASDNPNVGSTTNGSATYPPYGRISGTNGRNNGFNVRADLAHFLAQHRPTDIFVTGGCDRHPDHAATFFFLHDALEAVRASHPSYDPIVHQTIVWAAFNSEDDWPEAPNPTTYYTQPARIASCLREASLVWTQRESLDVPLPLQVPNFMTNLKSRAINLHASQGGFHALTVRNPGFDGHISAFVHKDEFFFSARASGSNRPPVPHAGLDQAVSPGALVTLDGSASFDAESDPIQYRWRQSEGPTVTLSNPSVQRPSFTVPAGATNTVFAFELKVSNDGSFTSAADAVSISTGGAPQPADGGVVPLDAGTPPVDAGQPTRDAGSGTDASTGAPDAGTQTDAGAKPPDAGALVDAGAPADASALDAAVGDASKPDDASEPLVDGSDPADDASAPDASAPDDDPGADDPIDDIDASDQEPVDPIPGDPSARDAKSPDDDRDTSGAKKSSDCSVAVGAQGSTAHGALFFALATAALLARRRRRRGGAAPSLAAPRSPT